MSDIVPGSFRLAKPKNKKLHPVTIANDFVTLFGFHHGEVERLKYNNRGKTDGSEKVIIRLPIILIWDGKELTYAKAERSDRMKILGEEYEIDRDVDDVFSYLPSEGCIDELCTPGAIHKIIREFDEKAFFDDVLAFYEHFFFFESKMLYHIVALFSINQCVFDAYNSTPYLYIRSPLEECGKSNLGRAICQMWNGIISTNLEAHHVYRMIHGCSPTFVFDESKSWDAKSKTDVRMQAILSVINSGYQKGLYVYRFKDSGKGFGNMKPEAFESYSPKVIITTQSSIPRDTQSRCAEIMMQRAPLDSAYSERWNQKDKGSNKTVREIWLERIRKNAAIFRLKHGMEIKQLAEEGNWKQELDHTNVFDKLSNRHLEIFKPLVVLCLKYKPEWSDITAKYIREFIEMRKTVSYSKEMTVLWALRKAYELAEFNGGQHIIGDESPIKIEMTETEGEVMWITAKLIGIIIDEHGIGTKEEFGRYPESTIGRILKEFGFVGTVRTGSGNYRKVKSSRLSERCLNYLGVPLMERGELSQEEKMTMITTTIREAKQIELETLFDVLNGKMTQDQITHCVKELRTNGVVAADGVGGKGVITWFGV